MGIDADATCKGSGQAGDLEHCCHQAEGDDATMFSCRICFEDVAKPSELISPCKCKGTLRYVHAKCLAKWQASVLRLGGQAGDERAYICSVCRAPYSVAPLRPCALRGCAASACSLAGCLCISMLALGLSGPPLLHLTLLLLLLLSMRLQSVVSVLVLLTMALIAALYARGVAVVVRVDRSGGQALSRVAGVVGPGTLLVASRELQHTLFEQSVVLLYEHSPAGAKGVLLTQPLDSVDQQHLWPQGMGFAEALKPHIQHFIGGPVGMPHQGRPASELFTLHHMAAVPGAQQLVAPARFALPLSANDSRPRLFAHHGAAMALAWQQRRRLQQERQQRQDGARGLHYGGSLADLLLAMQQKTQDGRPHGTDGHQQQAPQVRFFHGICGWAGGQLEAELRSGAWGVARAIPADVLATQPQQLWQQLVASNRPLWL